MSDNMGGLDTFDVGYTAAKAECAAELSANQQKLEAAETKNAELTRKLSDSDTLRRQYFSQMCEVIEKNDKLLAEAKSNAMPEGRKLLSARYVYSVLQQYYLDNRSARIDICSDDVYLILRAALSVAPQPETDRGSNE